MYLLSLGLFLVHLAFPLAQDFKLSQTNMDSAMANGVFAKDNTVAPKEKRVLSLFSLKGKTAIISGAGAGIGFAVAQAYAEAGANVAIWYNGNKRAIDRAAEIEKEFGVKCMWK